MGWQLIPAGLLLIGGFFLHESPLWLMRKNRAEEALAVLRELRHLPVDHQCMFFFPAIRFMDALTRSLDIQEEVAMMRNRLEEEEAISSRYGSGRWAFIRGAINELSQKGMRNRVFLVFCAFTLANMSGASAINYYSPTLFSSLGITDVSLYTGIYGLVKGLLTFSPPFIVNMSHVYNS